MPVADARLFETVPDQDHLHLFPHGEPKPDYEEVVNFLQLNKRDVSQATGCGVGAIRYDSRIPPELGARIREWAILLNLVADHFGGDREKTCLWFSMPNPLLGNMAPVDMIRWGRFRKLLRFVVDSRHTP